LYATAFDGSLEQNKLWLRGWRLQMSAPNKGVVPRGKILFPNLCPVCLSPNPSSLHSVASDYGKLNGFYVLFATTKHLIAQVPLCTDCAGKERRLQRYSSVSIAAGLLLAVAVSLWFDLGSWGWALLGVLFCAPGILVSESVGKPIRGGRYDENTVEFKFKSPEYAEQFRVVNRSQGYAPGQGLRPAQNSLRLMAAAPSLCRGLFPVWRAHGNFGVRICRGYQ